MRKGQGSLEYLIIIAAVLAIAAIVVLFLTGAFQSQQGGANISACKAAASRCANERATSTAAAATCEYCATACFDPVSELEVADNAVTNCLEGKPQFIAATS